MSFEAMAAAVLCPELCRSLLAVCLHLTPFPSVKNWFYVCEIHHFKVNNFFGIRAFAVLGIHQPPSSPETFLSSQLATSKWSLPISPFPRLQATTSLLPVSALTYSGYFI